MTNSDKRLSIQKNENKDSLTLNENQNLVDLSKFKRDITQADLEALDGLLTWSIRPMLDSLMFIFFRYLSQSNEIHAEDLNDHSQDIEFLIEFLLKLERGGRE